MVLVLQNWDDLRDYIERFGPIMEIAYRVESFGLTIKAGSYGCKVRTGEKEIHEILGYLKDKGGREVVRSQEDGFFFE